MYFFVLGFDNIHDKTPKTKRHLKFLNKSPLSTKGNRKPPDRIKYNIQVCKRFKGNSCNSCGEMIYNVSEKAKIEKEPKEGKVIFSRHFGYTQAKILSIKVKTLLKLQILLNLPGIDHLLCF